MSRRWIASLTTGSMRAKRSSAAWQAAGSRQQAVKTVASTRRAVIWSSKSLLIQAVEQRLHLSLSVLVPSPDCGCDAAAKRVLRLLIFAQPHERLAEHLVGGHIVRVHGNQI